MKETYPEHELEPLINQHLLQSTRRDHLRNDESALDRLCEREWLTEVSSLLNDGSAVLRLHPPSRFLDFGVSVCSVSGRVVNSEKHTNEQTYRATVAMTCSSLSSMIARIFCTTENHSSAELDTRGGARTHP